MPCLFLALTGYAGWNVMHGDLGLIAKQQRIGDIAAARGELARAEAERDAMDRRVAGLRGDRLDRDQLDERARSLLNLVGREEIVVPYGQGRRLH